MNRADQTARKRAGEILAGQPDGMSKSALHRELGCNRGTFRKLIASMEEKGEISVSMEDVPGQGTTAIVKATAGEPAAS